MNISERLVWSGEWLIPESHAGRRIGGSTNKEYDETEFAHSVAMVRGKYQDDAENRRRLAACWNFCLGVDTVGLEAIKGGMHGLLVQGADEQEELAAARALLADILKADDEALAQMKELGIDLPFDEQQALGLTERIRTFLKGAA